MLLSVGRLMLYQYGFFYSFETLFSFTKLPHYIVSTEFLSSINESESFQHQQLAVLTPI